MIVFNKWWEFDPGFACLLSDKARPAELKDWWPKFHDHPRPRRNPETPKKPGPCMPRAVFKRPKALIEIWCISDLLEYLPDEDKYQSSSACKAKRMEVMFRAKDPSLVIALGTASAGDFQTVNGSVVIGTTCFMHNSHPNGTNPNSNWDTTDFEKILSSTVTAKEFKTLIGPLGMPKDGTTARFLPPPLNAAPQFNVYAQHDAVAVGNVNVSDYRDYEETDKETLAAFRSAHPLAALGSLETTHGIIRTFGGPRFIFISGIVDRLGRFKDDVNPKPYAQNTCGAHNMGIVLASLLPRIESIL